MPLQVPDWSEVDLYRWRSRHGWTQAAAAEQLGVSLRTYNARETGESRVSRETVLACLHIDQLMHAPQLGAGI